jgi:streptogramin lyase
VRKVFISYARQNKPDIEQLVEHLRVLGCDIWHDSSLHGGQDWWEEILRRIAACDTFIAIISRDALNSTACRREFGWAESLDKPVLPVAVEPPPKALPRRFSKRQIVDYSDSEARDRAVLTLAGGLATLTAAPPLPDPLPEPPAAPLSYLTDLIDLVAEGKALDHDQQRHILNELEPALYSVDPEERRGGHDILEMLSSRDDLYADVYRTINRLKDIGDGPASVRSDDRGATQAPSVASAVGEAAAPPVSPPPADRTRAEGQPPTIPAVAASQVPATPAKEAAIPFGVSGARPPRTHPAEPAPTTTGDGRIGSIRPTATTPRPEQVPLFGRINRRTKIVLAAVALLVVVAGVAAILLISHKPRQGASSLPGSAPPPSRQVLLPFTGLSRPWGVAVGSAGNVYIADSKNNRVLKLPAGSTTPTELPFTGLNEPAGVAVDSAGNVYITDIGNSRVLKLPAGSATQDVLPFTGLNKPFGVAVDSAGNIYITDANNRVVKLAADSTTLTVLPFTGLSRPWGVAVDSAGNLYVTDWGNSRVLKLAADSTTPTVLPFTGLSRRPNGVVVDSAGNLYVTDWGNNRVLKLAAG